MTLVDAETGEIVTPSLAVLEDVIERGLATFVEVGGALAKIRDAELYRSTHGTFEDYCRDRWNLSRPTAYRLMRAADVVRALSPNGDIPAPESEAQARPLTRLLRKEPEKIAEAWAEAVESAPDGKPTAEIVAAAVAKVREAEQLRDDVAESIAKNRAAWAAHPDPDGARRAAALYAAVTKAHAAAAALRALFVYGTNDFDGWCEGKHEASAEGFRRCIDDITAVVDEANDWKESL